MIYMSDMTQCVRVILMIRFEYNTNHIMIKIALDRASCLSHKNANYTIIFSLFRLNYKQHMYTNNCIQKANAIRSKQAT